MKHGHKQLTAILVAAAVLLALAPSRSFAGDREWATAGKILTGVVTAQVLLGGLPVAVHPRATVIEHREIRYLPSCRPRPRHRTRVCRCRACSSGLTIRFESHRRRGRGHGRMIAQCHARRRSGRPGSVHIGAAPGHGRTQERPARPAVSGHARVRSDAHRSRRSRR